MHTDPKFQLTEKALRWLATHPGPLGAEYQPSDRSRRQYGPVTVVEGGRR